MCEISRLFIKVAEFSVKIAIFLNNLSFSSLIMIVQGRAKTKPTGGKLKPLHAKRIHEMGHEPILTKMAANHPKKIRTKGGLSKMQLLAADTANLYDPATKKYSQVKIKTVLKNPANRHFVRRNIITKGCIVNTDKGHARVTSRPSQDGVVNAILVKE